MVEKLFGTNGIRGVANEFMNIGLASKIGMAVGKQYGGNIAIGIDTRISSPMLRDAVSAGLMSVGSNVIDLGVLPTPAVQYYVKIHDDVSAGIMITASHNPPEFNGIKVISGDGTEACHAEEEAIEKLYAGKIGAVDWNLIGNLKSVEGADEAYVDAVISKVDAKSIRKAKLRVCLDCSNGASYHTSPMLLSKLGVETVILNNEPDGNFPGHPSEPVEENLHELIATTRNNKFDLGIAHDGDADRCMFVDETGAFISGECSLALLSRLLASKQDHAKVVTTIATSMVVEDAVSSVGGSVCYTAVGSPKVARRMMEEGAVFGGEGNGGLIFPSMQYCRDGAMALAVMLECIVKNGPLSKQLTGLPHYYMIKTKFDCPEDKKISLMKELYNKIKSTNKMDCTDGIKINCDGGWVLIRPSGTEPIGRIYSESKDCDIAKKIAEEYHSLVLQCINS